MEVDGAASSRRESVGLADAEDAAMLANSQSSGGDEDSNFEPPGASEETLPESEGSVSQNAFGSRDPSTVMLTPEKREPEDESSRGGLDEARDLDEKALDHDAVNRQESIECRSFVESDEYSENAPADNVSVKNYCTADDEGATPLFEDKKEIVGKESEDVVMEIAERLSQLRSIGKTAESARKYTLDSDTSAEDLDSNDHLADLLGPKRLDFEVIDFDQFGAQPPDLPLSDILTKLNHHVAISGKGAKAKKPESHVRVLDARSGVEQDTKGLHDSPGKMSVKSTPEKKHPRKERGAGTVDLPTGHVIPRLCNTMHEKEGSKGHDISRDSDTSSISGRTGSSKFRLPDSKKLSEAPSGSPIRRSKSTMPDVKGSPVHDETRKRTEDLQHLTYIQARRLEDYCNRVGLSIAQLEEQSRLHEELNRKLESECGELLKSEAKLMMLCEVLPGVQENLKNLCDQMLFMEVQLQEQVALGNKLEEALERERQERTHLGAELEEQLDLRNKLEGGLERERQERMHLAAKLEDQLDLRNKLERSLERELQERMHFVAKLEQQVGLKNKLGEDLEQERQERLQLAAKLDEQVDLRNKLEETWVQERKERKEHHSQLEEQIRLSEELAHKLEQERDERLTNEAGLMMLSETLPSMKEKLVDLNNQVESLIGQLQEQTQLNQELKEKLDQECKESLQHMAKTEDQAKMHEALAHKFEQGRDERIKNETSLKHLRERLPKGEEKLKDLQSQVLSLATLLQEQTELRKELEKRLDREREERIQSAAVMANYTSESLPASSVPWFEKQSDFTKMLDEQKKLLANQLKEAEITKDATEKKVGLLNHQVQNLEMLSEYVETMERVYSSKERAIRQTMWTLFQVLCLGSVLMTFIVSCRNPLQPT